MYYLDRAFRKLLPLIGLYKEYVPDTTIPSPQYYPPLIFNIHVVISDNTLGIFDVREGGV